MGGNPSKSKTGKEKEKDKDKSAHGDGRTAAEWGYHGKFHTNMVLSDEDMRIITSAWSQAANAALETYGAQIAANHDKFGRGAYHTAYWKQLSEARVPSDCAEFKKSKNWIGGRPHLIIDCSNVYNAYVQAASYNYDDADWSEFGDSTFMSTILARAWVAGLSDLRDLHFRDVFLSAGNHTGSMLRLKEDPRSGSQAKALMEWKDKVKPAGDQKEQKTMQKLSLAISPSTATAKSAAATTTDKRASVASPKKAAQPAGEKEPLLMPVMYPSLATN